MTRRQLHEASIVTAALVCAAALWAQAPYESPPEQLPRVVPPQPVAFSHKAHMDQRMACADCHPGAARAERAGIPQRDDCMVCHQAIATDSPAIRKLAARPRESRIRWERVYQVPDYVFFSHGAHATAGVECVTCHGPVASRAVLDQEISTNMVACMNCHAQREASVECFLCHDLGQ